MIKKWIVRPPETSVRLKAGSRVLHVDEQYEEVCVWTDDSFIADGAHEVDYVFLTVPSGVDAPLADYIGTVKVPGSRGESVMWHVFCVQQLPAGDDTFHTRKTLEAMSALQAQRALADGFTGT